MAVKYELHPQGDVLFRLQCRTKDEESDSENESANTDTTTQSVTKSLSSMGLENSLNEVTKDVNEKCFLVSSAHLSLASKVFSAMLQAGGFNEGETLRSAGYVEISLPDDDPDAFELLMNIVHNKSWLLPRHLDLKALVGLSILADKYQMEKALVFYVDTWIELLRPTRPITFTDQLAPWLSLSCTFDLAIDFKYLTRIAILESGRPKIAMFRGLCWKLDRWEGLALPLPYGLIDKIEEQRQSVLGAGFAAIQSQVNSLGGFWGVCTYKSQDSESSSAKTPKSKPATATGRSSSPSIANPASASLSFSFGGLATSPSSFGASPTPAVTPTSGVLFGSMPAGNNSGSATSPAPSLFGSRDPGATATPAPSSGGMFGSTSVRNTPTFSFGISILSSAEVATANRRAGCNGMMLGTFTISASKIELWPLPLAPYKGWCMADLPSRVGLIKCESLCHALNAADPKSDGLTPHAHGIDEALAKKLIEISKKVTGLDLEAFKQAGY